MLTRVNRPPGRIALAENAEYRDRLRIFDDTHEVAPGVFVRLTGGHTPGHSVVDLVSGGERLTLQYAPDDSGHYICYLSRQHLPLRMRVFIDFMTTKIRPADLDCLTDLGAPSLRLSNFLTLNLK